MSAVGAPSPAPVSRRGLAVRVVMLVVAAVAIYVVWPSILAEVERLPELGSLDPLWFALMFAFEAASFASLWLLLRLMLGSRRWFAVATAQLSENVLAKLVPGGTAAGQALQYRMLVAAGEQPARVGVALAASGVVDIATVLALPVLSLPFILLGSGVAPGLGRAALIGVGILLLVIGLMVPLIAADRPLRAIGRVLERIVGRLHPRSAPAPGLPDRLIAQRDQIREVLAARWWLALLFAAGNWGFDYLALVTAVAAVDPGFPDPALILLAYVTAQVLSTISITPGGIGFVEAGLAATLVLAAVPHGSAALATLAYRLASFWLPLPAGGVAYVLFRRRYATPAV